MLPLPWTAVGEGDSEDPGVWRLSKGEPGPEGEMSEGGYASGSYPSALLSTSLPEWSKV